MNIGTLDFDQFHFSYEYHFSKRFGANLELDFDNNDVRLSSTDIQNFQTFSFASKRIWPAIGAKYFTSKKKEGTYSGVYVGPYIRGNYLISRDPEYYTSYEEITGRPITDWLLRENTMTQMDYGAQFGYKAIFSDHFVFDLRGLATYFTFLNEAPPKTQGFDFELMFFIGYRF